LNASEKTEVVIGFENMLEMTRYGFSIVDKGFDCLWDAEFVSILPNYFADGVSEATRLVNEKGIKIRVITEIKKDNLESVVPLSKMYDVRHLQGIKGNFGILDRRQYIVVLFSSYDKPPEQGLFSNAKPFVDQQKYVFDTLWETGIPARVKIRQIELANEPEYTKPLFNTERSCDILTEFIDCSVKSILILLPRSKSIEWLSQPKIFEALQVASRRGVEVRIIMRDVDEVYKNWDNNLSIRYLASPLPNTHLDIVVDDKFTFSIDSERFSNADDEIELGTYSNIEAKAMVSSSIFENYWIKSVGSRISL
jgi:hypothetical protein